VGVDLGVAVFAATSEPVLTAAGKEQLFGNPRHLDNARRQLHKWQRRMAQRHVKGLPVHRGMAGGPGPGRAPHGAGRAAACFDPAPATKQLVTQFEHVALEDLRVKNMTRTARGTVEAPGRNVAAKAGLNRAMLDVGFGEIRRQIEYKAKWHGVRVTAVNPAYTSQTCHRCGHVDRKSRRTRSLFECTRCGHVTHADIGAAHNIKHRALDLDAPAEPR
uniref:RNA-guided endonuclease InsQ/TnpB family protein n=1 Tax=Streptomyces sp. IBSBF 3010 TaxID=2903526 RepID=UPI002FDC69CE